MKLDLGCGKTPIEGYVGIDLPLDDVALPVDAQNHHAHVDPNGIVRFDLASGIPWPFASDSVEGLHSSHTIEHLPSGRVATHRWDLGLFNQQVLKFTGFQDSLFWFMDEAWRVTKPGGEFLLRWPALVDETTGQVQVAAFQDPTHYRFVPARQLNYFSRAGRQALDVSQYRATCNWVPKLLEDGHPHILQRLLGGHVLENEVLLVKCP